MTVPLNLPQRANIQGFWKMEDASGNATDESGNGNNLTETSGTIVSATGQIGNCRDLERDDTEWFSIADGSQTGLDITGSITICFWVNFESKNSSLLVSKYDTVSSQRGYQISYDATNIIGVISDDGVGSDAVIGGSTFNVATWYHIGFVFDASGQNAYLYLNGVEDGSELSFTETGVNDSTAPFNIGNRADDAGGTLCHDGLMDEVIVWDTALTAAEVLQVKNITAYRYTIGTVGIGSPFMI